MLQCPLLQRGPSFSALHQRNSKECSSAEEAIRQIPAGSRVMVGGFGLCGIPENSLRALAQAGTPNLTIISALGGTADGGVGLLLQQQGQVRRLIVSYVGENPHLINLYLSGQLEVELLPLGSLAEAIRAAAAGIPAFYTPAGIGTAIQNGGTPICFNQPGNGFVHTFTKPKEVRTFNGQPYLLQESISAEYGLIKAWKADKAGNVIFRKTAKNFNEPMCKAAKKAIVEVEEIVEVGQLDPGRIDVPAAYVYAFYRGKKWEKLVERKRMKVQQQKENVRTEMEKSDLSRHRIAARAALELTSGMTVNLGIGIPVLVREYVPADLEVIFHSENGILGMGEYPATEEEVDADLTNAAKESITEVPGAAYLSADESFALIRGGHLQLTMLGAMQVSQYGDLANWMIPGKLIKGMGGAMDLVSSASSGTRVIVTMEHSSIDGERKIVPNCTLPLTGYRCVEMIITEKAVFKVHPTEGLTLLELANGETVESIAQVTGATFTLAEKLVTMQNGNTFLGA